MVSVFSVEGSVLHPRSPVFAGAWGLGKGLSLLWAQCSLWGSCGRLWRAITSCPSNKDARHIWNSGCPMLALWCDTWDVGFGYLGTFPLCAAPWLQMSVGNSENLFSSKPLMDVSGCPPVTPSPCSEIISAGSSKPWQSLRGPAKEPGLRGSCKGQSFILFPNVCRSCGQQTQSAE